jgi:tetratricopeptide (TPR) repeat protein
MAPRTIYLPDRLKKRLVEAATAAGFDVRRGAGSELVDYIERLLLIDSVCLPSKNKEETWSLFLQSITPIIQKLEKGVIVQKGSLQKMISENGILYLNINGMDEQKGFRQDDQIEEFTFNTTDYSIIGKAFSDLFMALGMDDFKFSNCAEANVLLITFMEIFRRLNNQAGTKEMIKIDTGYESKISSIDVKELAKIVIERILEDDPFATPFIEERISIAELALRLDPELIDGYNVLGGIYHEKGDHIKALEQYCFGVKLGEKVFTETNAEGCPIDNNRISWNNPKTRPYFRARLGELIELKSIGNIPLAIEKALDLIRLDPGDNFGVRYWLCNFMIVTRDIRLDEMLKTLRDYKDPDTGKSVQIGESTVYLYTKAIYLFSQEGDTRHSKDALRTAFTHNPFVPNLLHIFQNQNQIKISDNKEYDRGSYEEAMVYVHDALLAWKTVPNSFTWLETHTAKSRLLNK